MTTKKAIEEMRKINPEWAKALEEEPLHEDTNDDELSWHIMGSFTWRRSRRGRFFWVNVYDNLLGAGK